ncbi:histidine phosphatase family protein [Szabonella alba]|uniref:Histidine phosphatase family protein n=1 Tax=Szabonella alba TaxID=2804194 RepID=A0A8K0V6V6_9RHOB|nr:histidine phosphatase family protein [Szabonella alba]MBL4916839.1 histidine phosphatase family protein [Szabonella alba]
MQKFHFIRHAQSHHNALARPGEPDPMVRDAALTDLGHRQAQALGAEIGDAEGIELVVISPFTRTIQTGLHAFTGSKAPRVILDLHREHLDSYCDVGSDPAALAQSFPDLDFSQLRNPWWYVDPASDAPYAKEPPEMLAERVGAFAAWLKARPEQTIAVVSHGTFLWHLTGHRFANAERLIAGL